MSRWFRALAVVVALAVLTPVALSVTITGNDRPNRLVGTDRADVLNGRGGNDNLLGKAGRDTMRAGPGNDRVDGGPDRDRYFLGPGNDRANARDGIREPIICNEGRDVVIADEIDDVRDDCEIVRRPTPYVADALAAAKALTRIGNTLQRIRNTAGFRRRAPALRRDIDRFNDAVTMLKGYTVDDPTNEARRKALSKAGPPVASTLRRFVAAAAAGKNARVRALSKQLDARLEAFTKAAQVTAPSPPPTNCDPNYTGACVPPFPPDVDCSDIEGPVRVVGEDPHNLDRDGDKVACEPAS